MRVRYTDGTRGLEPGYVDSEISGLQLQIRFRDYSSTLVHLVRES